MIRFKDADSRPSNQSNLIRPGTTWCRTWSRTGRAPGPTGLVARSGGSMERRGESGKGNMRNSTTSIIILVRYAPSSADRASKLYRPHRVLESQFPVIAGLVAVLLAPTSSDCAYEFGYRGSIQSPVLSTSCLQLGAVKINDIIFKYTVCDKRAFGSLLLFEGISGDTIEFFVTCFID